MPLIPVKSMVRKCYLSYSNPLNQQHWIDEMKQAMPQFVEEIDRLQSLNEKT
jgi:hypothetical protein